MNGSIRTFRAPDARTALAAVKAALGPEAVILGTRSVPGGLFRDAEVEVTAGLSEPEPTPQPKPAPVNAVAAAAKYASPRAGAPAGDAGELDTELRLLRQGLADARRDLESLGHERRAARDLGLSPIAASIHERLCGRGVAPAAANAMLQTALEAEPHANRLQLEQRVRAQAAEWLVPDRAPWFASGKRILALVGPTGVGKTTTLAKIAARAVMEARRKVALITVDTYRIGASEQLARYGEIMDVPAFTAKDAAELSRCIARAANADLVLIDTAGRSTPEAVLRQAQMVRSVAGVQLYLTASAASGALDLAAIGERYRGLNPDRLIFTKLDEAAAPGGLLALATAIGRPVCALTDGQRVPEDIHAPSADELADLVVGTEGADAR